MSVLGNFHDLGLSGVPRRVVTVIEGENLTNDWTALTFYRQELELRRRLGDRAGEAWTLYSMSFTVPYGGVDIGAGAKLLGGDVRFVQVDGIGGTGRR